MLGHSEEDGFSPNPSLNENYRNLVLAILESALKEADRDFLEDTYCKNFIETINVNVTSDNIPPDIEEKKLRFSGMDLKHIAEELHTTREAARTFMQNRGWSYISSYHRNVSNDVVRLLRMGYKHSEIANFLNVSTKTIQKIVAEAI